MGNCLEFLTVIGDGKEKHGYRVHLFVFDRDRFFIDGLMKAACAYFRHKFWQVYVTDHNRRDSDITIVIQGRMAGCKGATPVRNPPVIWFNLREKRERVQAADGQCSCYAGMIYLTDSVDTVIEKLAEAFLLHEQDAGVKGGCRQCEGWGLTSRERRVISLIGNGLTPGEVARILNIHPKTVSAHKCTGMRKLGLRRTVDLFHWLRQSGQLNVMNRR